MSAPLRLEPDAGLLDRLEPMLELLAADPASLSSVTDPGRAREVHLLDSLAGTLVGELKEPASVVDIGSGAGFPGIPLATALPRSRFDLIDSVGRKVDFMNGVIEQLGLENARGVKARSEDWAGGPGRESYSVATARAVAPLVVLAELASPLLERGGVLVAWKGGREVEEEEALEGLGADLAMELDRVVPVQPFPSSRERHLYLLRKTAGTPDRLPRRPGMARKRPLAR